MIRDLNVIDDQPTEAARSRAAVDALADVRPVVAAAEAMHVRYVGGAYVDVDPDLVELVPIAVAGLLVRARRRLDQAVA